MSGAGTVQKAPLKKWDLTLMQGTGKCSFMWGMWINFLNPDPTWGITVLFSRCMPKSPFNFPSLVCMAGEISITIRADGKEQFHPHGNSSRRREEYGEKSSINTQEKEVLQKFAPAPKLGLKGSV